MRVEIQGEGAFDVPDDATPEEIDAIAKPAAKEPGFAEEHPVLHGAAKVVGGAVLPTKGSLLGWLASKVSGGRTDAYASPYIGDLSKGSPGPERQPNETDRAYALRAAHAALSPEAATKDSERMIPMLGLSLPGGKGPTEGALAKPREAVAGKLEEIAGNRNIKAAGAIQSDITRARKQVGREHLNELGQEMGTEKLVGPTTTPHSTFERAENVMDGAWNEMSKVVQAADQVPAAALPAPSLINRAGQDILYPMLSDPHQAAAAEKFMGLLGKYADVYGNSSLPPSKLHEIRKNISKDLYGWRGNKDPEADAMKSALHDFRSLVSDEINRSIDRAGMATEPWAAANRRYEVAAKAQEFADKGMDRAHGNNLVSPMEALAGMAAGSGLTASGHAGAGAGALVATLGAALARRHGSGALGALAQRTAAGIRPTSSPAGTMSPELVALMRSLSERGLLKSPVPAFGEDEP